LHPEFSATEFFEIHYTVIVPPFCQMTNNPIMITAPLYCPKSKVAQIEETVSITRAFAGIGKTRRYIQLKMATMYGVARIIEKMQDLKEYGIKPFSLDVTTKIFDDRTIYK